MTASGAAAAIDLRTGRIPNPLTALVAITGFALAGLGLSGHSMAGALVGALLGFALMLPGHILGGTGAGDVKLLAALGTVLADLATSGRAILVTSHDLEFVRDCAHRVLVLSEGTIVEDGDPAKVFAAPAHEATRTMLRGQQAAPRP